MDYIIDVIEATDRGEWVRSWNERVAALRARGGFVSAELFERKLDIRNAHYDFLAVYGFRDAESLRVAWSGGELPAVQGKQKVVRTHCKVEVNLAHQHGQESEHVWLVNPFEIHESQVGEVLDMWNGAKEHMIARSGFVDARLFRSCEASGQYGLFNVSQWKSAGMFMQALEDKAYDGHRNQSMNYSLHPSLCVRVSHVYA